MFHALLNVLLVSAGCISSCSMQSLSVTSLPIYREKEQCLFNLVSSQNTEMRSSVPLSGEYLHFQSGL